jgi:hypothetical protein
MEPVARVFILLWAPTEPTQYNNNRDGVHRTKNRACKDTFF